MTTILQPFQHITIPIQQIHAFCERNRIAKLALFGSVLRDDFRPDSDLDILVEFDPGHVPGFGFFDLQDELSALFDRPVDLNTLGFLSPHIRENVIQDAVVIYDKTES